MKKIQFTLLILFVALFISANAQDERDDVHELLAKSFNMGKKGWVREAKFFVNNKEFSYNDAMNLPADTIMKIEFYSKKSAIANFGKEDGRNGVVVIATHKKEQKKSVDTADVVFITPDEFPKFPGGQEGWQKFLQVNLHASVPVDNGCPVGIYIAKVKFIVNINGTVSEIILLGDPGYGTGKEALRVIKISGNWEPALYKGEKVKCYETQPIIFVVDEG